MTKLRKFLKDGVMTDQSSIFETDVLMTVLAEVFLRSKTLICRWHVNKIFSQNMENLCRRKTSQILWKHEISWSIINQETSTRCDLVNCEVWSRHYLKKTWFLIREKAHKCLDSPFWTQQHICWLRVIMRLQSDRSSILLLQPMKVYPCVFVTSCV